MSCWIGGVVVLLLCVINISHEITVGSCDIQSDASNALATATFGGSPRTTSSCVVNENCNYEVHVIGNYEGNGHTGFRMQNTGFTDLYITGSTSRRLILVLSSYEPVEWLLHIPAGVVIERVIISSFLDNAIAAPPGQVLAVENTLRYFAYSGSSNARSLLTNIQNRFGAISSFTGTYSADGWRLTIGSQRLSCNPDSVPSTAIPNTQPVSPSLRLVNGSSCQGSLELRAAVSLQLRFGLACGRDFGDDEARVVCRQLDCSAAGAQRVSVNQFGFSSSVDVYRGFRYVCNGSENSLSDCQPSVSVCTPDSASDAIAVRCGGTTPMPTTAAIATTPVPGCLDGNQCFSGYCSGGYSTGATCVNGMCQCLNNPRRDRCTCLSTIGSCHIQTGATNAVATATFRGSPRTTIYSCIANDNCDNEVHIIGNYESNGHSGFRVHNDGFTNLYLTVTGSSSRPLILVLASYEHVQWTLHIPSGVVIDRVIISSFLNSSIVAPPGKVLAVENNLRISAYGSDSGGGHTEELLTTISNRFGSISSFTGSYSADVWRLTINRGSPDGDCVSGPSNSVTASPSTPALPTLAFSLLGGDSCHGRLQIRSSQACDLNIGNNEAKVICRELGCDATGARRVNAYLYGFSAAVNSYQAIGYVCNGNESSLRDCRSIGSNCAADSVDHAIAVSCDASTSAPTGTQVTSIPTQIPSVSTVTTQITSPDSETCSEDSDRCYGDYCSGAYSTGATCVDGFCQCPNNPKRDRCTCLSIIGSCHVRNEANNAVASATFRGSPPRYGYTTYSCVANDNCDNEVHVIANYESNGHSGFRVHNDGFTNLYLTVTGSSSRPLILVLSSYEHVQWTLRIPSGVVIDRVIISSYLNSSIVAPPGQVLAVENSMRLFAYGPDDGGGETEELLTTIYNRFGPVSSFTGTYQADVWRLNINRRNRDSNCTSAPFELPTTQAPTRWPTPIPFTAMPTIGELILPTLSPAENQCFENRLSSNTNAIACATSIDAICGNIDCYQVFDQLLMACGRPNFLQTACASIGVYPPVSTMPTFSSGGSVSPLSSAEAECVDDRVAELSTSAAAFCLASSSPVDAICRSTDCYQAVDEVLTGCGRPDILPAACASIDVSPRTDSSSSKSVPSGVWVGIAFAVTVLAAVVVIIIFIVRRSMLAKQLPARPEPAGTSPQHVAYNAGNLYYQGPTDKPEGVMGLSSAAPPSYADLEADKVQLAAEYPPPSYGDLHPSVTAVQQ